MYMYLYTSTCHKTVFCNTCLLFFINTTIPITLRNIHTINRSSILNYTLFHKIHK